MSKIISLLTILILSCNQVSAQKIQLYSDTVAMRNEIIKHIPIGTDTLLAKAIMSKSRFKCQSYKKSTFASGKTYFTDLDYLYCTRSRTKKMISEQWQIALVHKNGIITAVIVSFGLTGP